MPEYDPYFLDDVATLRPFGARGVAVVLLAGNEGELAPGEEVAGYALRDSLDWVTDDESGDFLSELVRTPTPDTMRLQIQELSLTAVCAVVVRSLSVVRPHGVGRGRPGAADGARIGRQHLI